MSKLGKGTEQKPEDHWLTHNDMAKGHGVSVTAFREWGVQPVAKIGRCDYYTPDDVTANRLERLKARYEKQQAPVAALFKTGIIFQ